MINKYHDMHRGPLPSLQQRPSCPVQLPRDGAIFPSPALYLLPTGLL